MTIKLFERYAIEAISLRPNESEFRDGIGLRYSRDTGKMPLIFACWENVTVPQTICCQKVDYTRIRYELRDSFAILATDICDDVEVETHLQSIHEEIFAPKSATNWWYKTRKPFHLVR